MKLCMVGAWGHSIYTLESLSELPEIEWCGVYSGDENEPEYLLSEAKKIGATPRVYHDYIAMLEQEKPDIVSIDGRFDEHAMMCLEALKRNIHIFCEKPIALTIDDLSKIENALKTSSSKLISMVGLRYSPGMFLAHSMVESGTIGKVKLIYAQKSYRLGQRPEHYKKRETYGGTIPWVGSHALDWIMWFANSDFASVYATQTTADNFGNGDLEIAAQCLFTMKSGVLAEASIDYLRPAAAPSHGDDRVRVVGTSGIIEVRDDEVIIIDDLGKRTLTPNTPKRRIFSDFVYSLEGKGPFYVDTEQTLALTKACLLARQSADEHVLIFM